MTKPYQDKENLRKLHWKDGLSLRKIGEKYDMSHRTIGYWFDKHNLPRRGVGGEFPYARYQISHDHSDSAGYAIWRTKHKGKDFRVKVHRLLAVSEFGFEAVEGMVVHHKNGIKWDNRPDNIELMTNEEHARLHNEETRPWEYVNQ